jgi:hypothetical protein
MRILAQDAVILPIARPKTFDIARLGKPGQMDAPADAAVLARDLEAFLEIAAQVLGDHACRPG